MATVQDDTNTLTVDDLLRIAREDLARSSLSSAEKALEQAVLLNNQVAEAFHLLGMVYSKRGKFKKAILSFEKALSLDAFHTDAAIALSSLYNDVGKYKEGANIFLKTKKRLEKVAPGHDPRLNQGLAVRHFEIGNLYIRYERFSEAFQEFSKAFDLDPENLSSCVQMAKCLAKNDDRDAAISLLQSALEKDPKNTEARIQLGILFHSKQRLRDAYRQWQEVLSLEPENKSAQMYLSMFEYEPQRETTQT